jgi:hypothetical protein
MRLKVECSEIGNLCANKVFDRSPTLLLVVQVDLWLDGKTLTDKVAKTEMARTATYVKQTLQDARKKGLKVACKVLGTDSSSNIADAAMITLSKGSTSLAGLEEDITNDDAWAGWESVIEQEVTPLAE